MLSTYKAGTDTGHVKVVISQGRIVYKIGKYGVEIEEKSGK